MYFFFPESLHFLLLYFLFSFVTPGWRLRHKAPRSRLSKCSSRGGYSEDSGIEGMVSRTNVQGQELEGIARFEVEEVVEGT